MSTIIGKVIMGFVSLVALWNLSKVPFYLAFNNDGSDSYGDSTGVELSINLGHWFEGYRSVKMRTPPINFILVHCTVGITILAMSVLAMTNKYWRKKYCVPFCSFAIFHAIHTLPASWINNSPFRTLFLVACTLQTALGIWGIQTGQKYDADPAKADKTLAKVYGGVTFINAAAAFLEVPNIIGAFSSKSANGVFDIIKEGPHELYGKTPYDLLPEKVGLAFFLMFVGAVWFIWPLMLVQLDGAKKTKKA